MEKSTKSRILDEALVMFAENGYKGTNLRDLAARLELSKSALYKHYSSKEDIWNALLDRMEEYYNERFGSVEHMPKQPQSGAELLATSLQMLRFTVYDESIILTRKLLLTEQFHDERVSRMATQYFLESNHNMYTLIFTKMMEDGLMEKEDPRMLACMYTAHISSLIQWCTREPDLKEEVMKQAEEFLSYFILKYVKNRTQEI